MANKLFVASVLALWIGSMTWLIVEKVLPSVRGSRPPAAAGFETDRPVAWSVAWSGRPVGHAATIRQEGIQQTTELRSRVLLEDVPLLDLAPVWMKNVVGDIGKLKFDANTRMEFDSLGNFSAFESSIAVNDMPGILKMGGRVQDSYLELRLRSGELQYSPRVYIADQAALNEALFPDARLPHLYVGRTWQEKSYNPFHSPSNPVELVDVEVVEQLTINYIFDEDPRRVFKVEYRTSAGPGISNEARLQAVSWVDLDGTVLRQDVFISGAKLRFERLPPDESMEVGRQLLIDRVHRRRALPTESPRRRRDRDYADGAPDA